MITTEVVKAHLAGTVLPQQNLRAEKCGMSKVMAGEDRAPSEKQQTSPDASLCPTPTTAMAGSQEGRFDLPVYLAYLDTQKNQLNAFAKHKRRPL